MLYILVGILFLAMLGYVCTALTFALFPMAGRLQQAAPGPDAYLCTTLAHTDILLPSGKLPEDFRALFSATEPPRSSARTYLAFGWGDLRFFQETPYWSDIRLSTAMGALMGLHETALRVIAVNSPAGNPDCLPLPLDQAGNEALIRYIRNTLKLDDNGRAQRRPGGTGHEAFYLASNRYGLLRTCNQWATEALAAAGLPHALFAPFSFGVRWPLSRVTWHDAMLSP